jgi:PKD repeat protein
MKKISILLAIIPLALISCTKEPIANFTISNSWVGPNEDIYFTNRSIDAEAFEWDFGDGTFSSNFNVSHYYTQTGDYTVRLKAFREGIEDMAQMTVSVGASLEITVEEYLDPYYLVTDISVILYPTVTDWEKQTNMVIEGFTDSNGIVRFDHLNNQKYYVDVYGPNHDNYKLAAEAVSWIETPMLIHGALSTFTAVVDYYPPAKKYSLNRFETKSLRKIEAAGNEPRTRSERK